MLKRKRIIFVGIIIWLVFRMLNISFRGISEVQAKEKNDLILSTNSNGYIITFSSNEGYIRGMADNKFISKNVPSGSLIFNGTPSDYGYVNMSDKPHGVFKGWKDTETGIFYEYRVVYNLEINKNMNFVAVWADAYEIKYYSKEGYIGGDQDVMEYVVEVEKGYRMYNSCSVYGRSGYVLEGWESSVTGKLINRYEVGSYVPSSDETLKAKWTKGIVVECYSNGGIFNNGPSYDNQRHYEIAIGDKIISSRCGYSLPLTDPIRIDNINASFAGWLKDGELYSTEELNDVVFYENSEIYAKWNYVDHEHVLVEIDGTAVSPTCSRIGKEPNKKCLLCGDTVVGSIINMKNHTIIKDIYIAPTIENTGLTEGAHCSICGAVIKKQEVIPKITISDFGNKSVNTNEAQNIRAEKKSTNKEKELNAIENNNSIEKNVNKLVISLEGTRYIKSDGSVARSEWINIGEKNYYFNSDGYAASNEWRDQKWINEDGSCTYTAELMWKSNSTGWWVEDTSGWYPQDSWQKIDGVWYYFKPDGFMASGEYYNGYWFNVDGSWDDEYLFSWKSNSTGWWVEDISGWWPSNSWLKIDGEWYYFDAFGYMVTSQYVDGYWIGADGVCR